MSSKKSDTKEKEEGRGILRGLGKKIRSAAGFTDSNPYDDDDEVTVVTASGEVVTGTKVDDDDDGVRSVPVSVAGATMLQPGYQQQLAAQQMLQAQQTMQLAQAAHVQQLATAQAYQQQLALQSAALTGGYVPAGVGVGVPVAGVGVGGMPVAGMGVAGMPVAGMGVAGMPVAGMGVAGMPVAGMGVGMYPQAVYPYGTGMYTSLNDVPMYDPETGKRIYVEETHQVSSVKDLWRSDLL